MASQMTIGKKLFSSFGACVALTLAVGGTSLWLISSLGSSINKVAHVTARKQFLAAEIDGAESNMLAAERGILIRSMMKDADIVAQYNQYYQNAVSALKIELQEMKDLDEIQEVRYVLAAI